MKYKSKVDWWFYMILIVFTIISIWLFTFYIKDKYAPLLIMAIIFAAVECLFVIPMLIDTYYTLEDNCLHIKSWICCNTRISYQNIISFEETKDPSASAGLSTDRVRIKFFHNERQDCILISPKNKADFILQLQLRTKRT